MARNFLRLFLIAYALLPFVAVILLFTLVRQFEADLSPVYTSASTALNAATDGLRSGVENLEASFQPLVNSINALRSALSTVINFIANTINAIIDWIRTTTFGTVSLPRFNAITLPPIVDLSGLEVIADNARVISTQVSLVASTTIDTVNARLNTLITVFALFLL